MPAQIRFIDLFAGIGGFRYGLEKANRWLGGDTKEDLRISGRQETLNGSGSNLSQDERQDRRIGSSSHSESDNRELLQEKKTESLPEVQSQFKERPTGFTCVWSNEWDKYANSIYKKHYGECDDRDINTVPSSEIPDHDLLVGGFPCQAFSIAGNRRGFADTRGTLFFEIARILRDKRPRYFLLENVKGLLSHDQGKTLQTILGVLTDLGYEYQWQVLNSKNFGVPQNRERIFIIGNLAGERRLEILPLRESSEGADQGVHETQIVGALSAGGHSGGHHSSMTLLKEITKNLPDAQRVYDPSGLAKTLKGLGGGLGAKTGLYFVGGIGEPNRLKNGKFLSRNYKQGYRVYSDGGVANTVPSQSVGGPGGATGLYLTAPNKKRIDLSNIPDRPFQLLETRTEEGKRTRREIRQKEGRDSTLRGKDHKQYVPKNEDIANCLTTGKENVEKWVLRPDLKIRRLTPVECERLQGFPDGWTEGVSDSQRYKCLGNAVTTNVVTELGRRLLTEMLL